MQAPLKLSRGGGNWSRSAWSRAPAQPRAMATQQGAVSAGKDAAAAAAAAPAKRVVLVVAVALVDEQRRVLLAQRPEGRAMAGLWEFPGGKVDPGEVPEAALVRELQEELGIQVAPQDLRPLTFASHSYDSFHLLMPLYECRRWNGNPRGAEGQQLQWVKGADLGSYEMPAADIPLIDPILAALAR